MGVKEGKRDSSDRMAAILLVLQDVDATSASAHPLWMVQARKILSCAL